MILVMLDMTLDLRAARGAIPESMTSAHELSRGK